MWIPESVFDDSKFTWEEWDYEAEDKCYDEDKERDLFEVKEGLRSESNKVRNGNNN